MKTTVIFGAVLCLALSVLARRPEPTLPSYPVVFSATFNASELVYPWRQPQMRNVFVDLPNKRASINYASDDGQESWTLIYKPQGGDPSAPASHGYTMINVNPGYPAMNVPNNCMYMTGDPSYLAPFPDHWTPENFSIQQVGTWLDLPADLVYGGEYFIAELGVMSDRWDSESQCDLQQSGIGQVPCTSVMFSQGQNPLPLMDIRAFGALPDTFEVDKYEVRVYHSFETSVQDSDFALPKNWQSTCGNADNYFNVFPSWNLNVFDSGGSDGPLTIALTSPPIKGLGDVKVFLSPSPTWYYNCVDCLSFTGPLIFNRDNWNVSQVVPLKYNHNGCSQYDIEAIGGGYSWRYYVKSVIILTCQGENFDGCITPPKCGDPSFLI